MMPDVAKRQRTVQDGYGADHFPELGRGSDAVSLSGPTHQPMFPPTQGANKHGEKTRLADSLSDLLLI